MAGRERPDPAGTLEGGRAASGRLAASVARSGGPMPEVHVDDEAVLWSASAADREGRPLLLLLHGYNSNEGDLFGLAPYLPLEPAIASLRAPTSPGYGYAWFPLRRSTVTRPARRGGGAASTDAILALARPRRRPSRRPVGPARLLAGRRDGARAPAARPRAIRVRGEPRRASRCPGERDGDERMAQLAPPVFWGRGTADGVIAAGIHRAHASTWLPAHADARRAHLRGPRRTRSPTVELSRRRPRSSRRTCRAGRPSRVGGRSQ